METTLDNPFSLHYMRVITGVFGLEEFSGLKWVGTGW